LIAVITLISQLAKPNWKFLKFSFHFFLGTFANFSGKHQTWWYIYEYDAIDMMDESWFYIGRETPTYLIPLKKIVNLKVYYPCRARSCSPCYHWCVWEEKKTTSLVSICIFSVTSALFNPSSVWLLSWSLWQQAGWTDLYLKKLAYWMRSPQSSQWGASCTLHQSSNQCNCADHGKGADVHQIHMLRKVVTLNQRCW